MIATARARASRGPLRTAGVICTGLSGAALVLAGCSLGTSAGSSAQDGITHAGAPAPARHVPGSSSTAPARLAALASQSIIYTASLTIQATNVTAAASRAAGIATSVGGYVSSEHATVTPAGHARSAVSLQLKIPVAQYPATLSRLSAVPGTRRTSLTEQAQDVTQQVADVGSRVTSAHAAINRLQALLKRAGSVSDLLAVQEQINAQETSLEALQAQQRALARETSYATVSLTLVSPVPEPVPGQRAEHGFAAGLGAGWRGLRLVVSGLLTVLGAVLPFAGPVAALGAVGYAGRRRARRRGSRPTTAG